MNTVTLYPNNTLVRKPDGSHLETHGEEIKMNSFWYRRLRDGSVTCKKPKEPKEGAQ